MTLQWILLSFFTISLYEARRSPNELNVSLEPYNPVLFWPMTRAKHDTSYLHNHRYAFLERTGPPNASLISGTDMDVANFGTVGSKYILLNSFDDMGYNGFIDAISLNFNIYINDIDITQSTVLAQFIDANGTITVELRLEGLVVKARWLDINRVEYIGELKVKSGKWLLVGFQFNMLWAGDKQVDLHYIDSKGSATTAEVDMGKDLITLPVMDKIVIGGDYFGGSTFKGEIGCIQIYDKSILGGTRGDSVDFCDQAKADPDFGDFTIELPVLIPTTEGVTTEQMTEGVTTGQTTEGVTTEQTTDGVTIKQTTEGVSTEQTTTQYDVTMVNTEVTTNVMTTILSAGILATGYEPVVENCYYLKIVQTGQVLASPITSVQVTNLARCAAICNGHPQCLIFSLPTTGSGECRISDTAITTPMADYLVYSI